MDIIVENIKNLFIGNEKNKEERCSRCGGDHFDLSCIYSKN
jgi:hypothetical protein